ncbi:hypothetical protein [Dickeya ananatis]|uniref:hypothetical protein n=1 Tax=Dickeya ananatis TaxID=3061286 RepID=UPI00388E3CDF
MSKRLHFYRRAGKPGAPNAGLKERIVWQLSKRAMTGQELADILKMTRVELNRHLSTYLCSNGVAVISASEWVMTDKGYRDRTYTLERLGKSAYPTAEGKPQLFMSQRSLECHLSSSREKGREAAKRRAKLIAAGIYQDHMG